VSTVSRDTGRLVAFSDGVFAITITLLILEIRPPEDYADLLHGLAELWPSYLAYAVTFLFIGQVWANHHVMFDHIRAADRVVLLLNTVLLDLDNDTRITVNLRVHHVSELNQQSHGLRLGCEMVNLGGEGTRALQRYIDGTQKRRRMLAP